MQEGQRKIPVQYAKRVVGRRVYGGQSTHIPLRINTAGVIPVIFASSLILFPATLTRFMPPPVDAGRRRRAVARAGCTYTVLYMGLIIFFAYFYTAIVFNPIDLADNMKKYGGFIPGVRPGKKTAEYIDRSLTRITLPGALFLALISVLPDLLIRWFNVPVLLRRHQPADRGRRRPRHRAADGVAPAHAELRRLPQALQDALGRLRPEELSVRVIFLGAPGRRQGHAGAASWPREWGVPQIATGDMLREAVAARHAARAARPSAIMDAGALVPDDGDDRADRASGCASPTPRDGLHPRRLPAHDRPGRGARRLLEGPRAEARPGGLLRRRRARSCVRRLTGRRVCRQCGTALPPGVGAAAARRACATGAAASSTSGGRRARRRSATGSHVYERADRAPARLLPQPRPAGDDRRARARWTTVRGRHPAGGRRRPR